jgi:hypothetical protein
MISWLGALGAVDKVVTSRLQLILVARVGGAHLLELRRWTTRLRSCYLSPHPLLSVSWYWSTSPPGAPPLHPLFAVSTVNKGTGIVAAATSTDARSGYDCHQLSFSLLFFSFSTSN